MAQVHLHLEGLELFGQARPGLGTHFFVCPLLEAVEFLVDVHGGGGGRVEAAGGGRLGGVSEKEEEEREMGRMTRWGGGDSSRRWAVSMGRGPDCACTPAGTRMAAAISLERNPSASDRETRRAGEGFQHWRAACAAEVEREVERERKRKRRRERCGEGGRERGKGEARKVRREKRETATRVNILPSPGTDTGGNAEGGWLSGLFCSPCIRIGIAANGACGHCGGDQPPWRAPSLLSAATLPVLDMSILGFTRPALAHAVALSLALCCCAVSQPACACCVSFTLVARPAASRLLAPPPPPPPSPQPRRRRRRRPEGEGMLVVSPAASASAQRPLFCQRRSEQIAAATTSTSNSTSTNTSTNTATTRRRWPSCPPYAMHMYRPCIYYQALGVAPKKASLGRPRAPYA